MFDFFVSNSLAAFSASEGTLLWEGSLMKTSHHCPEDLFVINGQVWSTNTGKPQNGGTHFLVMNLFTGEIWTAQRATDLGLIDGVGHLKPKMQDHFGDKVQFRRYELRRPLWSRFGAQMAQDALFGIEERAAYARFGL